MEERVEEAGRRGRAGRSAAVGGRRRPPATSVPRRAGSSPDRRLAAAVLALVTLLATLGCSRPPLEPVRIGSPLPAITLTTLGGDPVDSAQWIGSVTLVNFWATWCAPCRSEIPVLERLSRRGGLRVVGASLDEDGAAAVRPFAQRHGMTYELLVADQAAFERVDGLGVPYTLLLDERGVLRRVFRGPVSEEALADVLAELGVPAATGGAAGQQDDAEGVEEAA
ncbi:MAG: TlpA family protein disulfide reductase [Acidobacteria bacterium]|nr:MAG: TlpA family protein disulfide reductase [Acidobacteriota bacterium]REK08679.1 MAG: TlpA family protein disulfide reductase [Acidobacteriota bacterium]